MQYLWSIQNANLDTVFTIVQQVITNENING